MKIRLIFPEIVEQAGETGFGSGVKRSRAFFGEGGDIPQMGVESLPFPGGFRQAIALGVFGGVGVEVHDQPCVGAHTNFAAVTESRRGLLQKFLRGSFGGRDFDARLTP